MTLTELIEFDIEQNGIKILTLVIRFGVSRHIIKTILEGGKVHPKYAEKIASHYGYYHSDILVKIDDQQVSK